MNLLKSFLTLVIISTFPLFTHAQCADGEVEVELIVYTDNYGYEGYWQIVPAGNNCDDGTVAEGGNMLVGCNGAGAQNQNAGGYANNQTYTEGPWCLSEGESFDLIYTDDWGDGAFNFEILVNGYVVETFEGMGIGATFNWVASEPPTYDMGVFGSNLYQYVEVGEFTIDVDVFNAGTETVNTFDLNYSINDGDPVTANINFVQLDNNEGEHVPHPIPWTISEFGVYDVDIWVSNINGNEDQNENNDLLTFQVEAGPGRPDIIDAYVDGNISIEEIAGPGHSINKPTDLDFHPVLSNKELWVINKDSENTGGSTVTIYNAGEPDQDELWKRDGNAWHFMSLPTGIAFSANGNFANSPGIFDANHQGNNTAFTGPALWSSDMEIYAEPSGGNGSHLDMLHESPKCQGICAEVDNVFWVFDGYNQDIVRYDFKQDHGPGNDDHSDGVIRRYSSAQVLMDPAEEIVSHLDLDQNNHWLYVVDHGNAKVFRIDISTGSASGGTPSYGPFETLAEYSTYTGYVQEDVVTEGLIKPAGIAVMEDHLIVSEHQTGEIVIYDITSMPATELRRIPTGYSSLQGITIGPEGRIWGVDYDTHSVFVMNSDAVGIDDLADSNLSIYPNPGKHRTRVNSDMPMDEIRILDISGKLCTSISCNGNTTQEIDIRAYESGVYLVEVISGTTKSVEKLVVE